MMSCQDALRTVLDAIQPLAPRSVPIEEALGRILARSVRAAWDLPPADNSAMDGYAFPHAGESKGSELAVTGFVPAGAPSAAPVAAGEAVKIMTGAPLPPGCDTVVPLEDTEEIPGGIRLLRTAAPGQHVRLRGEEMRGGEEILRPGTAIQAAEVALLAAAGIGEVSIHPPPRVALLSTGDELVELGEAPGPGQIVNSNAHLLAARLREEGCDVLRLGIARDEPGDLADKIGEGLRADLLITTGGVSVGDRDLVRRTLEGYGFTLGFWRVSIKPGKPVLFGTVGKTPVFGLPGNPAASAATFEIFVRPALRRLAGHRDPLHPRLRARLSEAVQGGEKRRRFLWGTLREEEGRYVFLPSPRQSSGQNRSLLGARALLPVPGGSSGLEKDAEVEILLLRLPPGFSGDPGE